MTLITITGHIESPDGGDVKGQLEFSPVREFRNTTSNIIVPVTIVRVQLDAGGTIPAGFQLYATDDAGTEPPGVKYRLVYKLVNFGKVEPDYFSLPNTPGSQDLADLLA